MKNEDLVRLGYEEFNREKAPPSTWVPDGEFVNAREDPDHATYRGIDAIRKQHQALGPVAGEPKAVGLSE
jgi:hypothetical protein